MVAAISCLVGPGGCTRSFYRKRADKEVSTVLAEKNRYPQWSIEQYHVYPDPMARFADPTDPDRPPIPPDDPAAWDLSPHPQKPGKKGTQYVRGVGYLNLLAEWDVRNRAAAEQEKKDASSEAPGTTADLAGPTGPAGATAEPSPFGDIPTFESKGPCKPFLITLEQAVELGLINSREYQDHREDLYLTALPVTLERFAFAPQLFATEEAIRTRAGREVPGGPRNDWTLNSNVGFTKLFSTGALLLFRVANQTVINLSHLDPIETISQSTLTLDLIQPLLRGGGRAVTLEPLTQAERNLLYEIRTFARFRKEFFFSIAGGGSVTPSASSLGRVAALTPGFVNFSSGDIARPQITPSGAGRLDLATAGLGAAAGAVTGTTTAGTVDLTTLATGGGGAIASGYLPTLLVAGQLANERANTSALIGIYRLFDAFKEGGDVSQLQVDQVEQQLQSSRTRIISFDQQLNQALDRFKIRLGLPTDIPLELEDSPVRPVNQQFRRYERIFQQFDAARDRAAAQGSVEDIPHLRGILHGLFRDTPLSQGTRFRETISDRWAVWERLTDAQLSQRLEANVKERRALRNQRGEWEDRRQPVPPDLARALEQIDFESNLGDFEMLLRQYERQPWRKAPDADTARREQATRFRDLVNAFALVLSEARNERLIKLREEWPELARACVAQTDLVADEFDRAQTVVSQTALTERLDLMNARAGLVDDWRQVAIFANDLLGTFNVEYRFNSYTPAGQAKPLAFGGSRNQNQLFLNGELPLVRKLERNTYRAALIAYQRRRRALMANEDQILLAVRTDLRQLRQQAETYKIAKRQVELAYFQVENSLDVFRQPPQPTPVTAGTSTAATTNAVSAAALTTQLLGAQQSLVGAQNQMISAWINYHVIRMQLFLDLELMPLDPRGVWTDVAATCQCPAERNPDRRPADAGNQAGNGESGALERLPDLRVHAGAPGAPAEQRR